MSHVIHGGAHWQPAIRAPGDYDRIVCADVNDAWYPPAPRVLQAIAEWAARSNHSPDTSGCSLREALAREFAVPAETLRLGAGSSDLLHHIVSSFVAPGEELLTPSPTYGEYPATRVLRLNAEDHFRLDAQALLTDVRPETRLLVLCNPNNPTGGVFCRADLLHVLRNLPRETFVLVDEAYIDFAPAESVFGDVLEFPNLAVVRTFSKAFAMAGLRVGYAALGDRAAELFDHRPRPPWPVGLLGLHAAEVALEERCYVEQRVAEYTELKAALLADLTVPAVPSATHYFLADLAGTGVAASDLLPPLRRQGVFLREFATFCHFLPERFIRITTQSPADNRRLASAFNKSLAYSIR